MMNVMPMRDEEYKDIELKPTKEQVNKQSDIRTLPYSVSGLNI